MSAPTPFDAGAQYRRAQQFFVAALGATDAHAVTLLTTSAWHSVKGTACRWGEASACRWPSA
jgi:hypothetical protein